MRIIAALDDGPLGLDALATRVEADRRTVGRHARVLTQAGLVDGSRSGRGTTYRLASSPSFSDEEYGSIPDAVRRAAVASALAHCHTTAASALEAGGFDRADIHLTRTSLELTEAQWSALAKRFEELLDSIEATGAEPVDASARRMRASAVLMLFERAGAGAAHPSEHDDEPFSMAEGLERSWELSEELDAALNATSADWPKVVAVADRLRVLARAAMAAESSEGAAGGRRASEDLSSR